jgi:YesN/AraC family two-component response regulator
MLEDGVAGYEKIKNNDYDLVLCDIKMPKWMVLNCLKQ